MEIIRVDNMPELPELDIFGLGYYLELSPARQAQLEAKGYTVVEIYRAQNLVIFSKRQYVEDVHYILQDDVRNEINQHLNAAAIHRNQINEAAAAHGYTPLDSELVYFPPELRYTMPSQLFGGSVVGDACVTICVQLKKVVIFITMYK